MLLVSSVPHHQVICSYALYSLVITYSTKSKKLQKVIQGRRCMSSLKQRQCCTIDARTSVQEKVKRNFCGQPQTVKFIIKANFKVGQHRASNCLKYSQLGELCPGGYNQGRRSNLRCTLQGKKKEVIPQDKIALRNMLVAAYVTSVHK